MSQVIEAVDAIASAFVGEVVVALIIVALIGAILLFVSAWSQH